MTDTATIITGTQRQFQLEDPATAVRKVHELAASYGILLG
jgi:hypothetical protein